jgi:hypothetical protein
MHLSFIKSYTDTPDGHQRNVFQFEFSKKTSMPLSDKILKSIITLVEQNCSEYIPSVPSYLIIAQNQIGERSFTTLRAFFVLESEDGIKEENIETGAPVPEAIELHRLLREYDCSHEIIIWMVNAMNRYGGNPFWVKTFPIGGSGKAEE